MSLEGMSAQEIERLAELAQGLSANPKTRQGFLQLSKQAYPDTVIPEVDIPASLRQALDGPLKQLDALTKAQQERDMRDRIEASRRDLMTSKGVTAAEMPKLEKLMVDKGIANHDTALEHLRMQERAAEPTPSTTAYGSRKFEKPTMPDMKAFNGDMKAFSYKNAYDVIDEMRGRKAAA